EHEARARTPSKSGSGSFLPLPLPARARARASCSCSSHTAILPHSLSPLPAGAEEGDVVPFVVRMPLALLEVQVDAEAGALGEVEVAVDHLGRVIDDAGLPIHVELVEYLLDEI